jgi:hypothetical protein
MMPILQALAVVPLVLAVGVRNDRYYFRPPAYGTFRARRRKRALLILTVVLIGVAILYMRGTLS